MAGLIGLDFMVDLNAAATIFALRVFALSFGQSQRD